MPRPRIFVSSTYYDLRHIRNDLEIFLEQYGFEPVLFEKGQVTYDHQRPLDLACYQEVRSCQMLILIIGGRYGSPSSEDNPGKTADSFFEWYNSITREEYLTAIGEGIPTYIFIDRAVNSEYYTFLRNRNNPDVIYAHVDNHNIFRFIEEIHSQFSNNVICEFERFEDIANWLRNQWAGLFHEYLTTKQQASQLGTLSEGISDLRDVVDTLRAYLENMLELSHVAEAPQIISKQEERLQRIRDSRAKSKVIESPMVKYLCQHTELEQDALLEALQASQSLEELLRAAKIPDKEIDYVLSEPLAEVHFEENKALLEGL